jgi:hypothetical protein
MDCPHNNLFLDVPQCITVFADGGHSPIVYTCVDCNSPVVINGPVKVIKDASTLVH